MRWTTATLTIHSFSTQLSLSVEGWRPGCPFARINLLGGDDKELWITNYPKYFQADADRELTARGYRRVGDWEKQNWAQDTFTAGIEPAGPVSEER